jgi:acyl-CoA synthetase (AMP-forming)/AMP-acid ligase II
MPRQKIIIVDPESLRALSPGQVGEVWVSGPSVAQGYWNRVAETEHTFKAFLADTGEGPFLRTGDLGFLLDGELFLTGRLKDLIIIAGSNHYPHDIERTVERSHPVIKPSYCAAFSVEINNNEQVVVVVGVEHRYLQKHSRQDHVTGNGKLLSFKSEEVIKAVKQAVAEHHDLRLHKVVLIRSKDIPKTSSGKIQRHACRAAYIAGSLTVLED